MQAIATNQLQQQPYQKCHLADETALACFFEQFYNRLYLFANSLCFDEGYAAEIASEAFYLTWLHRAQLKTFEHTRAYLYTIVRNACFNYVQRKKPLPFDDPAFQQEPNKTAQDMIISAETISQLHNAIVSLPRQCRAVMESLFIEGRNGEETAKFLKLRSSTVRAQKRRGIYALRKRFLR